MQAAKAVRITRAIFQRLELGLRKRVVVGDMRTTVGFGHSQSDEQGRNRFGGHRAPPVGVDGQLFRHNPLFRTGLGNQCLG